MILRPTIKFLILSLAAVPCSALPYCTGGVRLGFWLKGKLGLTWVGAWVVHGMVHGGGSGGGEC